MGNGMEAEPPVGALDQVEEIHHTTVLADQSEGLSIRYSRRGDVVVTPEALGHRAAKLCQGGLGEERLGLRFAGRT